MTHSRRSALVAISNVGLALGIAPVLTANAARAQGEPSMSALMKEQPLPDMAIGSASAPVTIIEYASMTCGHCAHFAKETFPKVKSTYVDTGKVRFILREFPLDTLAAAVFILARAKADGDASKYFQLIEGFFATQSEWAVKNPVEPLKKAARQMGISEDEFVKAIENRDLLDKVSKVRDYAADTLNVKGTPTFFINGERLSEAATFEKMSEAIDSKLKT